MSGCCVYLQSLTRSSRIVWLDKLCKTNVRVEARLNFLAAQNLMQGPKSRSEYTSNWASVISIRSASTETKSVIGR